MHDKEALKRLEEKDRYLSSVNWKEQWKDREGAKGRDKRKAEGDKGFK